MSSDRVGTSDSSAMDPVCGMTVDPGTAKHKLEHAGRTYYFCCAHCLQKFSAAPGQYLGPVKPPPPLKMVEIGAAKPRTYATTHGELTGQSGPRRPARGQDSVDQPAPESRGAYVCPMCPEVRQSTPGPCPKCGMALEPETPEAATR